MSHLPNFLVIGAMKAATTSLHRYLDEHSEIAMAQAKEVNFFTPQVSARRDETWYRAHFPVGAPMIGESSPSYTVHPFVRGVPERAAALIPDARLIYLVRDPIERLRSHYVHRVAAGQEDRTFDAVVASLEDELSDAQHQQARLVDVSGYLTRSMYFRQVSRWLECFSAAQLMIVSQEDLGANRAGVLREVFEFLGVDPDFTSPGFVEQHNTSGRKRAVGRFGGAVRTPGARRMVAALPPRIRGPLVDAFIRAFDSPVETPALSPRQRARITELLRNDVEALRRHTGRGFASWSV